MNLRGEDNTTDRRRKVLLGALGVIIGVIAVSGAVTAALYQPDADDADADDADAEGAVGNDSVMSDFRTEWEHTFPAGYSGPVWITVATPDAELCTLTLSWGPWRRGIRHASAETVTYHFRQDDPDNTVPIVVMAEPAAAVTFGTGSPPVAAVDVNEGWEDVEDDDGDLGVR